MAEAGAVHGPLSAGPANGWSVTLAPDGLLRGSFAAGGSPAPARVEVRYEGARWATLPVLDAGLDGPDPSFSGRLPPVRAARRADVAVVDPESGALLFERRAFDHQPQRNALGLCAADVFATVDRPLFAAPWLAFDGARLIISGAHLPPGGDPARLSVRMAPGVRHAFRYPLPGPEFGTQFWFWPNAHLSNFILTIELAESAWGADPFCFDFVYADEAAPELRQRVWLPSDLHSYVGHPHDVSQVRRTQGTLGQPSITLTGYSTFRTLEAMLARHGVHGADAPAILDWGCGHGRVTRHLLHHWPAADVFGADVDAENIAWCRANMHRGTFVAVPLLPPTPLPAAHFDAVVAVSVMTHLTAATQQAWLGELHRILKPGGVALLTFGDASAAAYGSLWQGPGWWSGWLEAGFDDGIADPALNGKIGDDSYYRHTVQSAAFTRREWSHLFEVVSIERDLIGNQSLAVLRRR
ncbi:MAG: methyltransferase domain-containing protein [Janthinobacterium lividum]